MAIHCPNCGAELPDGVSFCDVCGTPLRGQASVATFASQSTGSGGGAAPVPIGSVACPVCGAAALPGEAFCDNCGAALIPSSGSQAQNPYPAQTQFQPQPPPQQYNPQPVQTQAPQQSWSQAAPARQLSASLVVTSPPPPATLPIPPRSELIVGRSDPQSNSYPDVDLGPYGGLDLGVSRRHFRLTRNGDQTYIEDLNAMNGTVVNGQKLPPYTLQPLRSGDRISLGKMELRFELA